MPTHSTRITADHESLSVLRHQVREWMQSFGELPATLVGDVELALTELAANVIDHTSAQAVTSELTHSGEHLVLTVTSAGRRGDIPPVERWAELPTGDRGYGLRIVQGLASNVELTGDDERVGIRCEFSLS